MSRAATREAPWAALVGPTASGKSEVALALAESEGWEILSLDSRRVYRRLDIGTAKPGPADRARVPHHLLDLVEPDAAYDAQRYVADARAAMRAVAGRGSRPLFEGGTGLYLRALRAGGMDGPPSDPAVRAALEAELAARGRAAMHAELARLDPASAARVHPHDTFRVVRALEIARLAGRPASEVRAGGLRGRGAPRGAEEEAAEAGAGALPGAVVALSRPKAELDRRIAARWEAMLRAGLLEEVRALLAEGFDPGLRAFRAPGYREMVAHLGGALSREEAGARAVAATRRYAKRQLTWFRHQERAAWVDLGGCDEREALSRTRRALAQIGVALRGPLR